METYVSLDEIKRQLNIDSELFEEDDQLLEQYIIAAQKAVELHIGYSLPEILNQYGQLDENVKLAIMLLVGNWYNNREATNELTQKSVPLAYEYLLQQIKSYRFNH